MAEFNFGFDLQHSDNIATEFEVRVECEVRFVNSEETKVTHTVIKQDDDSVIELESLDIRDRKEIEAKAENPPQRAIDHAWDEYQHRNDDLRIQEYRDRNLFD